MTDNDKKMRELLENVMPDTLMIKDIMDANGIQPQEIMRALYLLSNVKNISGWGKVTILMQDGKIVSVQQEQQFKSVV